METVIRVAVIYLFVIMYFRVLGKREVGQLSPFDLVLLMLIPDIAQQGMVREDYSITNALIGLSTLLSLVFLNSMLTYRFKRLESLVEGEPTILFHAGKFMEKAMYLERVSPGEVIASMHKSGFESLDQVKWVVLEPDGQLAFVPYAVERRPSAPAESKEPSSAA